jgi:hypothetical protein
VTELTVTVPAELLANARAVNADLDVSTLLTEALQSMLGCTHDTLVCARCRKGVLRGDIIERPLTLFYLDLLALITDHARKDGSVVGLGKRVRELAVTHQLRVAASMPLPSVTRAERQANKVRDLPKPPKPTAEPAAKLHSVPDRAADAG